MPPEGFRYYTNEELSAFEGAEVSYVTTTGNVEKAVLRRQGSKFYLEGSCCSQYAHTALLLIQ